MSTKPNKTVPAADRSEPVTKYAASTMSQDELLSETHARAAASLSIVLDCLDMVEGQTELARRAENIAAQLVTVLSDLQLIRPVLKSDAGTETKYEYTLIDEEGNSWRVTARFRPDGTLKALERVQVGDDALNQPLPALPGMTTQPS